MASLNFHPDEQNSAKFLQGTVKRSLNFNPEDDAKALRKAMRGIGTDEKAITEILTNRCNQQRQEIIKEYSSYFDRDLMTDLKSELTGNYSEVIRSLMMTPRDYDTFALHKSLRGNKMGLSEILCDKNNDDIQRLKMDYLDKFKTEILKDVADHTNGNYRKIVEYILKGIRDESAPINTQIASVDSSILNSGSLNDFIRVFCTRNHDQLNITFEEFKRKFGIDILRHIDNKFSGDFAFILKALVGIARNTPEYFAISLHDSMKGLGTCDSRLIRVVVSRSEIDLHQIKSEFFRMYKKTLEKYIKDDTSGDYRRALTSVVKGN